MKRIVVFVCCLLLLVGCAKGEKTPEIISNDMYAAPNNPTNYQIECYNALSELLNDKGESKEIAQAVAVAFASDFYTFSNKTSDKDIGGMDYFPIEKRDAAKEYISFYYYKNYSPLKNQYGEDSLPCVKHIVAVEPIEGEFTDETLNQTYPCYEVRLDISYEETKIAQAALKTETVITLVKYDGVYRVVEIK